MPTPAVSLRFRRFKRQLGIAAPKVVVRSVWPRSVLFLVSVAFLLLFGLLVVLLTESGAEPEVAELRLQLQHHQEALASLKALVDTDANANSIERAKEALLLQKIRDLEQENSALKEDLLTFERLLPAGGKDVSARVESFRLIRDFSGAYQYRALLAFQSPKRGDIFRGEFQLVLSVRLADGVGKRLLFPDKSERFVEIRHFMRREGRLSLPEGAELISVEAQLLRDGKLISTQSASS